MDNTGIDVERGSVPAQYYSRKRLRKEGSSWLTILTR